jgi:hypothetical protein
MVSILLYLPDSANKELLEMCEPFARQTYESKTAEACATRFQQHSLMKLDHDSLQLLDGTTAIVLLPLKQKRQIIGLV